MFRLPRETVLVASSISFWLLGLSPVGDLAQLSGLALSIGCSVAAIEDSRKSIVIQAKVKATEIVKQEIETIHLELQAESEIRELESLYSLEVREDLVQSLESTYQADSAITSLNTSPTTSQELKLAIVALLESGKSKTFVIEEVLGMKGRKFEQGKKLLDQILE